MIGVSMNIQNKIFYAVLIFLLCSCGDNSSFQKSTLLRQTPTVAPATKPAPIGASAGTTSAQDSVGYKMRAEIVNSNSTTKMCSTSGVCMTTGIVR